MTEINYDQRRAVFGLDYVKKQVKKKEKGI